MRRKEVLLMARLSWSTSRHFMCPDIAETGYLYNYDMENERTASQRKDFKGRRLFC